MSKSAADRPLSASVGDYLKAIWTIAEDGAASTNEISGRLSVAPASVTNMLARLQEMGFASYERYRGASLTERGREEAVRLVRRHRLLETFLIAYLGYSWQEVHEEAERLEHVVSEDFTERLAKLLEYPEHDPHGDPIPTAEGAVAREDSRPLSEVCAGQRIRIARVTDSDASRLSYLGERGLVPGSALNVKETRAVDGVVAVEDRGGNVHHLGNPLANSIFVLPFLEDEA